MGRRGAALLRGLALAALASVAVGRAANTSDGLETTVLGTWIQVDDPSDHIVIEFRPDHTLRVLASCGHFDGNLTAAMPWRVGPTGRMQLNAGRDGQVQFTDVGLDVDGGRLTWRIMDGAVAHFESHPEGSTPPCPPSAH